MRRAKGSEGLTAEDHGDLNVEAGGIALRGGEELDDATRTGALGSKTLGGERGRAALGDAVESVAEGGVRGGDLRGGFGVGVLWGEVGSQNMLGVGKGRREDEQE